MGRLDEAGCLARGRRGSDARLRVPALLGAHLTALSYFPPTRALLVNLPPCSLFVSPRDYKLRGAGPRLSHSCCEAQGMVGQGRKGRKEGDGWMHRRGIRLGHVRGGQS